MAHGLCHSQQQAVVGARASDRNNGGRTGTGGWTPRWDASPVGLEYREATAADIAEVGRDEFQTNSHPVPKIRLVEAAAEVCGNWLGIRPFPQPHREYLEQTAPNRLRWADKWLTKAPANRPPETVGTLAPLTIGVDEPAVSVEVQGAFRDPDGNALTYGATSSAPSVASVRVAESRVTVTPMSRGSATVTVTATDVGGSNTAAIQSFTVTVVAPFTDHPIVPGETPVRAIHFSELRSRIDGLRTRAGLAAYGWTDRALTARVTAVRLVHLLELRSALAGAYAAAGRQAPSWTDAAPAAGATPIRAVHLMELRAAVAALE